MSLPKITVNADSRVQATVTRLVVTRDTNGNIISQTFVPVYGTHFADLQLLSDSDRFANLQLKIEVTHRIFPEPYLGKGVVQLLNDFFNVDGAKYRVKTIHDFRTLAYFDVFFETTGVVP